MCEDISVAMVTNMISQLQESFPLIFWTFIHGMASRCEDSAVNSDFLNELPNFHIDTFSKLEEHSGRFAEVSESDVEKFMNRHLSAEFWLMLNAIWVAPVTAKLSSKTVISKKQERRWKRNKSNSSDMDSETDQKPQQLLRTTKLRFFSTKSSMD